MSKFDILSPMTEKDLSDHFEKLMQQIGTARQAKIIGSVVCNGGEVVEEKYDTPINAEIDIADGSVRRTNDL